MCVSLGVGVTPVGCVEMSNLEVECPRVNATIETDCFNYECINVCSQDHRIPCDCDKLDCGRVLAHIEGPLTGAPL
jgi:hypothetical protein